MYMKKSSIPFALAFALLCLFACEKTPEPKLSIPQTDFSVGGDGGSFRVVVTANVTLSVDISDDWISQSKVYPDSGIYVFAVACNDSYGSCEARTGSVTFSNPESGLSQTVYVRQEQGSPLIAFQDQLAKDICVKQWDSNHDGELSEKEAASVKDLYGDFSGVSHFDELRYFTGIRTIPSLLFNMVRSLLSVTLPEGLETIETGAFINCSGLTHLVIPQSVKSIGQGAFGGIPFSRIDILATTPPTVPDYVFSWLKDDCLIYVPEGTAATYQQTEGWSVLGLRITEEGHSPFDFLYASTDYSRDGEVVCLQKATEGAGINLIFLGDGFLDKDMETGGKYESFMKRWMEQFFVYEPYKTFRNWFSVYTVKVVSKNRYFGSPDLERRLTRDTEEGDYDEAGNRNALLIDVCEQYAGLVPNPNGQANKVCVFVNAEGSVGRSWLDWYPDGSCLGICFESIEARPTVINHELGGHGFAFLDDEYAEVDGLYPNAQRILENSWNRGERLNIDWRSDPAEVRWSRYLQDERYAAEGLGVFEGGGFYSKGIFRPTENSIMRIDYAPGAVFNAPSREAIYRHIMRLGVGEDWTFDYETFVEADKAGREQAAEAYSTYINSRTKAAAKEYAPGLPPILIDHDVREVRVSKNGEVTIVR